MGAIASQITGLTIVYSTVYSDADQRKYQSSASQAFVQGINRGPVNSKWPVTHKCLHLMTSSRWCPARSKPSTFAEHLLLVVLMICVQVYNKPVINNLHFQPSVNINCNNWHHIHVLLKMPFRCIFRFTNVNRNVMTNSVSYMNAGFLQINYVMKT